MLQLRAQLSDKARPTRDGNGFRRMIVALSPAAGKVSPTCTSPDAGHGSCRQCSQLRSLGDLNEAGSEQGCCQLHFVTLRCNLL